MKTRQNKCLLTPPGTDEKCPLQRTPSQQRTADGPGVLVVRTERRSWITLAITAFGALLLRYLKTVRERGLQARPLMNQNKRRKERP